MRKRTFIEVIQNILNGGDTTPDVKSKAHPAVIGANIANAISEIVFNGRQDLLGNLAVQYADLSVVKDDNNIWYTVFPVRPIAGSRSVTLAVDDIGRAITVRQTISDNFNLNFISPNQHNVTAYVRGKKLVYNKKPCTPNGNPIESVTLHIIPEFNELGDGDYVVMPGAENAVIRAVLAVMGYTNQVPEERLDNLKVDRENQTP